MPPQSKAAILAAGLHGSHNGEPGADALLPVLLRLPRAAEMPAERLVRMVRLWVALNRVRLFLLAGAWLMALRAFSLGG